MYQECTLVGVDAVIHKCIFLVQMSPSNNSETKTGYNENLFEMVKDRSRWSKIVQAGKRWSKLVLDLDQDLYI